MHRSIGIFPEIIYIKKRIIYLLITFSFKSERSIASKRPYSIEDDIANQNNTLYNWETWI